MVLTNYAATITINNSALIPPQNIAVNVPNQTFGGIRVIVTDEPITVNQMRFWLTSTNHINNATIVDYNGSVVSGPVDTLLNTSYLTFTDAVTFPVGTNIYVIKGKLSSSYTNNQTLTLSTTPSNDWSTAIGQVSGNNIPLQSDTVQLSTVTAKAGALRIRLANTTIPTTIVEGTYQTVVARIELDATQSGEDVRISNLPLLLNARYMNSSDLSGCQLFDGSVPLNTGSEVVNPGSTGGFTFTQNRSIGSVGEDVFNLQTVLNMSAGTQLASSGAGSPGNETFYFGSQTKAGLIKYQTMYGIVPNDGAFGPITRAHMNARGYPRNFVIPRFTFDHSIVIAKGTVKTLSLKINVKNGVAGIFAWGIADAAAEYTGATGATSSMTIDEVFQSSLGQAVTVVGSAPTSQINGVEFIAGNQPSNSMTRLTIEAWDSTRTYQIQQSSNLVTWQDVENAVFQGSTNIREFKIDSAQPNLFFRVKESLPQRLTVSLDSSSPTSQVAASGTTGVTLGVYRFTALYEAMNLQGIGLKLSTESLPQDLVGNQVTVWDGATQVGTAIFFGQGPGGTAQCTFSYSVVIPANGSKALVIKGDIASIGIGQPGTSGHLIAVDYDDTNPERTTAIGASSGLTFTAAGSTKVSGVRTFKSFPIITAGTQPGVLYNGFNDLMTITVTAHDAGEIELEQITFKIGTSECSLTNLTLVGPNGNIGTISSSGNLFAVTFDSASNTSDRVIPASASKSYTLQGLVTGVIPGSAIMTKLVPEEGYLDSPLVMGTREQVRNGANHLYIWSPRSLGSVNADLDWTNGHGLPSPTGEGLIRILAK